MSFQALTAPPGTEDTRAARGPKRITDVLGALRALHSRLLRYVKDGLLLAAAPGATELQLLLTPLEGAPLLIDLTPVPTSCRPIVLLALTFWLFAVIQGPRERAGPTSTLTWQDVRQLANIASRPDTWADPAGMGPQQARSADDLVGVPWFDAVTHFCMVLDNPIRQPLATNTAAQLTTTVLRFLDWLRVRVTGPSVQALDSEPRLREARGVALSAAREDVLAATNKTPSDGMASFLVGVLTSPPFDRAVYVSSMDAASSIASRDPMYVAYISWQPMHTRLPVHVLTHLQAPAPSGAAGAATPPTPPYRLRSMILSMHVLEAAQPMYVTLTAQQDNTWRLMHARGSSRAIEAFDGTKGVIVEDHLISGALRALGLTRSNVDISIMAVLLQKST